MVLIASGIALIAAEAVESLSRPRRKFGRTLYSLPLRFSMWLMLFGIFLVLVGNLWISSIFVLLAAAVLAMASNLKFRVLGEPLVFSDLAIFMAAFRFPRLYLFAVPVAARSAILLGVLATVFCIALGFVADWHAHFIGLMLVIGNMALLQIGLYSSLMRTPDLMRDVKLHGVALTVLFYWQRWRAIRNAPIDDAVGKIFASAELLIIVQNESFCDPQDLIAGSAALRGLKDARQSAWAWGNLAVDCFGAYTMRAEFGVLCGIEDSSLGFRRYDPFPTASGQAKFSLPARLPDHRSIFLHPYDLRFFGRADIMQHLGFDEILGNADTLAPKVEDGPYVSDRVLAAKITTYIDDPTPSLIYAVTMENHGPWMDGRIPGQRGGWPGYLHHLRNGDAMLETLIAALRERKRDAVLAFFGDHRPSIPGVVEDGAERHTPYVILRLSNGQCHSGPGRLDLTPAGLHHAILEAASVVAEDVSSQRQDCSLDVPVPNG